MEPNDRIKQLEGAIEEFLQRQARYHVDTHSGAYVLLRDVLKKDENPTTDASTHRRLHGVMCGSPDEPCSCK